MITQHVNEENCKNDKQKLHIYGKMREQEDANEEEDKEKAYVHF